MECGCALQKRWGWHHLWNLNANQLFFQCKGAKDKAEWLVGETAASGGLPQQNVILAVVVTMVERNSLMPKKQYL